MKENQMNRQEMITDFQHFLDTHKEEVKAHICQPPYDFLDDDWEEGQEKAKCSRNKCREEEKE